MRINERIIKNKVGLLNLSEELGNVSEACLVMSFSCDTFYRYKAASEEGESRICWIKVASNRTSKTASTRALKSGWSRSRRKPGAGTTAGGQRTEQRGVGDLTGRSALCVDQPSIANLPVAVEGLGKESGRRRVGLNRETVGGPGEEERA